MKFLNIYSHLKYGGFNGHYYILTKTNKLELFNKENEKLKDLKQQI